MAEATPAILHFNSGLISPLGMARADLKRMGASAQVQTNWMPRVLGSMMLRPGMTYKGNTRLNARAKFLPFVFSTTDVVLLECTPGILRMWLPSPLDLPTSGYEPDTLLTRVAVSTAITNGTFLTNLAGWTNADQAGAVSQWNASSYMQLTGTGFNAAKQYQLVTVAAGDVNKEHALRIVIPINGTRVTLNVGTTAGDGTYARNLTLEEGTHSIAFTPTGNFYVQFSNALVMPVYVKSVAIEAAGVVELPTPWGAAVLPTLRLDQSGEVVYVASDTTISQQKIQRWGSFGNVGYRSFSIVYFASLDGPFMLENTGPTTLTASATTGAITLTASQPLFQSGHEGALFRMASNGQYVTVSASGVNQFSSSVQVTGLAANAGRSMAVLVTGTFVGTVVLQRSIGAPGVWENVPAAFWTVPVTGPYDDQLDNQVIFYRIGIGAAYTSGTAVCSLALTRGSITGVVRITGITNSTTAAGFVQQLPGDTGTLHGLGSTAATDAWWEGMWSTVRGFPTSVALYDGRLWFAGRNAVVGSVADGYESFDDLVVGNSGPIIRTIGSGPVDVINWVLPLQRLVLGAQGAEKGCAASTYTGALTPTDFNMKDIGTLGSAAIAAVKVDYNGIFVQRSGRRVYKLVYRPSAFGQDYTEADLTNFVPDIAVSEDGVLLSTQGIYMLAVQRQPDTRIHAVLNDGTVRVLVFDDAEEQQAWIKVETGGLVEDVVILPGQGDTAEDLVYYSVARTINGATVRFLELWNTEAECIGGAMSKLADAGTTFQNAMLSTTVYAGTHLIGASVVCWADGVDMGGPFTVNGSGYITVGTAVLAGYTGLGYTARFKSTKLAYAAQMGSPLTQVKKIARIGLVLANTHWQGLRYGNSFSRMYDLPAIYKGATVATGTIFTSYDDISVAFPGTWDTDSRLCLEASAPRPATVLAAVMTMETRERS